MVSRMVLAQFPEVKKDDKFNWFWVGIQNDDSINSYIRLDNMPINYMSLAHNHMESWGKKYGLVHKNGFYTFKNSDTLMARGLCSRAINCWNIDTAVTNGTVSFSDESLKEGTVATVTCADSFSLVGTNLLACVAGQWDADLPLCVKKEQKEGDNKEEMEEETEKDKNEGGEEEGKEVVREEDEDEGAGEKEEDEKEENEEKMENETEKDKNEGGEEEGKEVVREEDEDEGAGEKEEDEKEENEEKMENEKKGKKGKKRRNKNKKTKKDKKNKTN